jgi:hypothetical protein
MARYLDEATKRTSDRKKATVLSVVSRIDVQLFLTPDQRHQIEKGISSRWQDSWENWLTSMDFGDQYFPTIPDECVTPHLNSEQKKIWNRLPKMDCESWEGDFGENPINDDWWGPKDADEDEVLNGPAPNFF